MLSRRAGGVPGYGADGEVGGGLRLVHEKLQVDTALVSGHGHDGVRLPLVALVEQLWDKPDMKGRLLTEEAWIPLWLPTPRSGWLGPQHVCPEPTSLSRGPSQHVGGSPITGHTLTTLHGAQSRTQGTLPAVRGAPFCIHVRSVLWGLPECVDSHAGRRGAELLETITILLANPSIFPLWRLGH